MRRHRSSFSPSDGTGREPIAVRCTLKNSLFVLLHAKRVELVLQLEFATSGFFQGLNREGSKGHQLDHRNGILKLGFGHVLLILQSTNVRDARCNCMTVG